MTGTEVCQAQTQVRPDEAVACIKAAGHEGSHWGVKGNGYDVVWLDVVLEPPTKQ